MKSNLVENLDAYTAQICCFEALLAYDPTHTLTLHNRFVREMSKRFNSLVRDIKEAVVRDDCFGLKEPKDNIIRIRDAVRVTVLSSPGKRAFDFTRSQDKVSSFMDWINKRTDVTILHRAQLGMGVEEPWTNLYVNSAYQTGIIRARQELRGAGYTVPTIDEAGGISTAWATPFHMDRVGVLYTRGFEDLKGITSNMSTQMSRVLSQGMIEGRGPRDITKMLISTIKAPAFPGVTDTLRRFIPAETRAKTLARTEIIRAHHLATVQEYQNWGAVGVKVMAEWRTAGKISGRGEVCEECLEMSKKGPYTLEEIEGLIPYHPNCRCIALPLDVTDKGKEGVVEEAPISKTEEVLSSGKVKEKLIQGGGSNGCYMVSVKKGKSSERMIFKPISEERADWFGYTRDSSCSMANREVLAYEMDKLIGLKYVPPTVLREIDGKIGSCQLFKDGQMAGQWKGRGLTSPERYKSGIFDYLIGNGDRHDWNYLRATNGAPILIDNGLSFPFGGYGESLSSKYITKGFAVEEELTISGAVKKQMLEGVRAVKTKLDDLAQQFGLDEFQLEGIRNRISNLERAIPDDLVYKLFEIKEGL